MNLAKKSVAEKYAAHTVEYSIVQDICSNNATNMDSLIHKMKNSSAYIDVLGKVE